MRKVAPPAELPCIPVLDVGPEFPVETFEREELHANALLDAATRYVPKAALRMLDALSRRWLVKWDNPHLAEIDDIARRLRRPGAYFLSVNYEWGCTCAVRPSPEQRSARLVRVLDWRTPGLGRHVLAARVNGAAGSYVSLTWPGYTGVLQAMAPGRFSVAINQAPMRKTVGFLPFDWAANRKRVWRMPHATSAHLLREVLETARTYAEAKHALTTHPIASPAIFCLAGLEPHETAVIERTELDASVHEGSQVAANSWQSPGWTGHDRGLDSPGRARQMRALDPQLEPDFGWLTPPVLNTRTRLAMIADARAGRLVAQGLEATGPATQILDFSA